MFRWSVAVIVLCMAINAYNLGGSAARPATAPDWARDKYGNVTIAPATYYATADDARVNTARQGTGLLPADKCYGITSHGQTLRTSADQRLGRGRKDRPAVPSAGGGAESISLAAIKSDKGYAHKRYDDSSGKPSRHYSTPRKRGKRGRGKGGRA